MWAALAMGRRCSDESYWVHPSAADAAVHAGAALRGAQDLDMMVSVAVGYYGVHTALTGKRAEALLFFSSSNTYLCCGCCMHRALRRELVSSTAVNRLARAGVLIGRVVSLVGG